MLKNSKAIEAIYIQGRSKEVPVITLTQRPNWLSRFAFSEAEFFQVFRLNDDRDKDTVYNFAKLDLETTLPKHHSRWYDVESEVSAVFAPVPPKAEILATFKRRIKPRKFFI